MISVVCSTKTKSPEFESHVKNSCGLKNIDFLYYENKGQYSLTEIYNKGLKESKYNIVTFIHDDLDFSKCKNWGRVVVNNFQYNPTYGILGVAGTMRLNDNGTWWSEKYLTHGVVWHQNKGETYRTTFSNNVNKKDIQEASCVDGVFFSCDKTKIKQGFDEDFKGFHFYDLSFCISNFVLGVKIGIHTNIEIIHKSIGMTNQQWEENRLLFIEKFKKGFPYYVNVKIPTSHNSLKLDSYPTISIVIPTKDKTDLLLDLLDSIQDSSKYDKSKMFFYIADTGSSKANKIEIIDYIEGMIEDGYNINFIEYDYYNFAKINNDVVFNKIKEKTELILFCNNDIELINDSISHMVKIYLEHKNNVGTIGCRMHYGDGTIQHLGIAMFDSKTEDIQIGHYLKGVNFNNASNSDGQFIKTYGNTAGFMLTPFNLFVNENGFNEEYEICFEDVEYNTSLLEQGKINYTSLKGVCYHFESQTRGKSMSQKDLEMVKTFIRKSEKVYKSIKKINK